MLIYKQIQKVFLSIIFLILIITTIAPTVLVAADSTIEGLKATANIGYGTEKYKTDVSSTIGEVVGAGLAFIVIVFLILMIYGGWIWMFAQGNEQEVEKAKGLIVAAIIGLLIVLGAYAITSYVGGAVGQK